jgi:hypothetical protein
MACPSWIRAVTPVLATHNTSSASSPAGRPCHRTAPPSTAPPPSRLGRPAHVRRVAARRDRQQHVAGPPQRLHLLRKHLAEIVVVRDRRQHRAVRRQRDGPHRAAAPAGTGSPARPRNAGRRPRSRRCRTPAPCRPAEALAMPAATASIAGRSVVSTSCAASRCPSANASQSMPSPYAGSPAVFFRDRISLTSTDTPLRSQVPRCSWSNLAHARLHQLAQLRNPRPVRTPSTSPTASAPRTARRCVFSQATAANSSFSPSR